MAPRVVGYLGRAKSDVALSQASNIATSLELFYYDLGRYPTPQEGLNALLTAPPDAAGWRGPYLKEDTALIDPWGREYVYAPGATSDQFTVTSLGRDNVLGGTGEDADIVKR